MKIAVRRAVARLLGRHDDGSRHDWVESKTPLGRHSCEPMSYCHHYLAECRHCGGKRTAGYAVAEVR